MTRKINKTKNISDIIKENKCLKEENKKLKAQVEKLEDVNKELLNRIKIIENKINTVTIREIMKSFENYIVLEVLGSIGSMRKNKIYTIKNLVNHKNKDIQQRFKDSRWYSKDELFELIEFYKEVGNDFIHNSDINKDVFLKAIDTEDQNEKDLLIYIADELEVFCQKYRKQFGRGPLHK